MLKTLLCASALVLQLWGAEPPNGTAPSADDLNQLRERIAKQDEEIKMLQQAVSEQRALLEKAIQASSGTANGAGTVNVANTTAAPVQIVPAINVTRPQVAMQKTDTKPSPLGIRIGDTTFSPLGFVDATFFGRSTNLGSGLGTNFAAIPFNNVATGHISEMNFTAQNSRIGFRVDSKVYGAKVLGYFEADFLGNQASNIFVTSNADTFRMRNVFVDVEKDGFEVLGGQNWSMFTPNRRGLSPIPSDIFYTQNMDTNYQAGLVWARQTQFRFIAHPNENLAFGASLENPEQYIGGSAGAPIITLPSGTIASTAASQFNNGASNYTAPNLHPDIIFKAAYDGHVGDNQIMHVEAGGMVRSFRAAVPIGTPVSFQKNTATAASGEVNANLEVAKGFRLIANTFFGSGNGRYVFGLAPDVIIRPDGSISPIHTYSTVDGIEWTVAKNTLISAYYGGVYIGRNIAYDPVQRLYVGYGPSSTHNRTIQEGTFGITQTFWKNPNYGALSLITQYSYLTRNPWTVAIGGPKTAHSNMYWVDLRYTLP